MAWYNSSARDAFERFSRAFIVGGTNRERKRGESYSYTDVWNMYGDALQADAERAYNWRLTQEQWQHEEDMYNKYQSPAAMMQQYREAGLNPALMYTGGQATTPPSVSGASGSSNAPTAGSAADAGGMNNPLEVMMGIVQMLMQGAQVGSGINAQTAKASSDRADANLKQAQEDNVRQNTLKQQEETIALRISNRYLEAEKRMGLDKMFVQISNGLKDLKVKDNQILVGDSVIQLNVSKGQEAQASAILHEAQARFMDMSTKEKEQLLPLVKAVKASEMVLNLVKTDTERSVAIENYSQACRNFGEALKLQKYLDNGGVEADIARTTAETGLAGAQTKLVAEETKTEKATRVREYVQAGTMVVDTQLKGIGAFASVLDALIPF